jgi:hypothetical protein
MIDTAEIQLSLAAIWEYLSPRVVDVDIGPYPQEQIVIGAGVSKHKLGSAVEIARLDALAACKAWMAFTQGQRQALKDPRFGRVLETIGYTIGLKAGLPATPALQFGEWLSRTLTGTEWTEGQEETEKTMRRLERIAKQAAFRPAAIAVLNALRQTATPSSAVNSCKVQPDQEAQADYPESTCCLTDVIRGRKISWTLRGDDTHLPRRVQAIFKFLDTLKATPAEPQAHKQGARQGSDTECIASVTTTPRKSDPQTSCVMTNGVALSKDS